METREGSDGPAALKVSGAGLEAVLRGDARSRALGGESGAIGGDERRRDIELADILEAIRRNASALEAAEQSPHIVQDVGVQDDGLAAVGGLTTVESKPPSAASPAKLPLQVAASPHEQASAAPAHGAAAVVRHSRLSRIPTVAASRHVKTDAAERARRLQEERRRSDGGTSPADEEATVSFVVRVGQQG